MTIVVLHRNDINQSRLKSRINQSLSVNNYLYSSEQSKHSQIKQPVVSGSNDTVTDSTIKQPVKPSEPEYETITTDTKLAADNTNDESWL